MPSKQVERVARRMYAAGFGSEEFKREILSGCHPIPRNANLDINLLIAAKWHLRELRRARGRTVGYVEVIKGTRDIIDGESGEARCEVAPRFLHEDALVARVVLVGKRKRK